MTKTAKHERTHQAHQEDAERGGGAWDRVVRVAKALKAKHDRNRSHRAWQESLSEARQRPAEDYRRPIPEGTSARRADDAMHHLLRTMGVDTDRPDIARVSSPGRSNEAVAQGVSVVFGNPRNPMDLAMTRQDLQRRFDRTGSDALVQFGGVVPEVAFTESEGLETASPAWNDYITPSVRGISIERTSYTHDISGQVRGRVNVIVHKAEGDAGGDRVELLDVYSMDEVEGGGFSEPQLREYVSSRRRSGFQYIDHRQSPEEVQASFGQVMDIAMATHIPQAAQPVGAAH